MPPSTATGGDGSRQNAAPNRSHKSPERPRGGKMRRTLIESACTACQKRKSRCDGMRPECSRCQALHTECGYNAEEGESRWSALRRRIRALENERDEARVLIAQIQSRPESEAHELVHQLRTNVNARDLGAFIHEAVRSISSHASQQQEQGQSTQQAQPFYYGPQSHHQDSTQQSQSQQPRHTAQPHTQQQRPAQQQDQGFFAQPTYTSHSSSTAGPQLPPLRSVVEVPAGGHSTAQLPQSFPPLTQRNMSLGSNISSGSYSSLSSSDRYGRQSLSPRELPHSS